MSQEPSRLVEGAIASPLVPGEVLYFALLPPQYGEYEEPLPLVLSLHGGGGSRDQLKGQQPRMEEIWTEGSLPPMVIVTPTVGPRSMYMDFMDGSQKWESFLVGPFLNQIRARFNVRTDVKGTMVTGISMGGMGSLRLAFKFPEIFGAVAALEPAIEPIDDWRDVRAKHRFWRENEAMEPIFGHPISREYWNRNNPATIAQQRSDAIREAGLKIFIEVGDQDMFWLYEGAEFLHRILWREKIRHEYRLYYGADHVGESLELRNDAAYQFLAGALVDEDIDPSIQVTRAYVDRLKQGLDEVDHYEVDAHLVRSKSAQ